MTSIRNNCLLLLVCILLCGVSMPTYSAQETTKSSKSTLRNNMKDLWDDHMVYTRNLIISSISSIGDKDRITERLLRNQQEIGNSFIPMYGDQAGIKITRLLKEHVNIASEIVESARKSETNSYQSAVKKIHQNADELSKYLTNLNPYWNSNDLRGMLYKHISYMNGEINARVKKDWLADIEAYDRGHEHMMLFSEMITNGMINQNPNSFYK
jgi:hypothetical protein